jgi:glycosyltransferase involved in cell wall biosynthesis
MKNITIAAHIPTYNCPELLLKCVSNILWVDEIIIADNSTNEMVKEVISQIAHHNIKYFKSEEADIRLRLLEYNDKTDSDYILWVHTDEFYDVKAEVEIRTVLSNKAELKEGYMVPSISYVYGLYYGKGHDQLRLFKKDKYFFEMKTMHDMPKVKSEFGLLKVGYAHLNSENLTGQILKVVLYEGNDAKLMNDEQLNKLRTDKLSSFQIKVHYVKMILKIIKATYSILFKKNTGLLDLWVSYFYITSKIIKDVSSTELVRNKENGVYGENFVSNKEWF